MLNLAFALSSLSLVINDFRFDVSSPQTYNKTYSLLFKQWREKNEFLLWKNGPGGCVLCRSYQAERRVAVEGAHSLSPLRKALINPDLSGALTRGGKARRWRGLESGGGGVWQLAF